MTIGFGRVVIHGVEQDDPYIDGLEKLDSFQVLLIGSSSVSLAPKTHAMTEQPGQSLSRPALTGVSHYTNLAKHLRNETVIEPVPAPTFKKLS
jgi:hypothetical protein